MTSQQLPPTDVGPGRPDADGQLRDDGEDGTVVPAAGLALLDAVAGLDGYAFFHASRAVLLRRLGREVEADAADRLATSRPVSEPVRRVLGPDERPDERPVGDD